MAGEVFRRTTDTIKNALNDRHQIDEHIFPFRIIFGPAIESEVLAGLHTAIQSLAPETLQTIARLTERFVEIEWARRRGFKDERIKDLLSEMKDDEMDPNALKALSEVESINDEEDTGKQNRAQLQVKLQLQVAENLAQTLMGEAPSDWEAFLREQVEEPLIPFEERFRRLR